MSTEKPVLYSYWRSSCSWRVRLALAIKGVEYEYRAVHLVKDGGEQKTDEYAAVNPQKLVPSLAIDGLVLTQSLAIIEYLEERFPDAPRLLPADAAGRARVRGLAEIVACDTQPVQNLRVLVYLGAERKMEWGKHWITEGFVALERALASSPHTGTYCHGESVTLADLCLVPQVYNANRFSVEMSAFPTIARIHAALVELEPFKAAHPSVQPDAQ
eukprot:TRINITY_DN3877_c0_g1_i1.p1 TRINITY_DN3877_c0_g1~~TRINITY_DN3877_c0_g1_i1.p1  ORF type:complete len:230 (-),score=81.88 TRINITY_DN3877_c0_g1_i1:640-1284(-)